MGSPSTIRAEVTSSCDYCYHQQYLAKNPHGYRCHATTGVPFPAEA